MNLVNKQVFANCLQTDVFANSAAPALAPELSKQTPVCKQGVCKHGCMQTVYKQFANT